MSFKIFFIQDFINQLVFPYCLVIYHQKLILRVKKKRLLKILQGKYKKLKKKLEI